MEDLEGKYRNFREGKDLYIIAAESSCFGRRVCGINNGIILISALNLIPLAFLLLETTENFR